MTVGGIVLLSKPATVGWPCVAELDSDSGWHCVVELARREVVVLCCVKNHPQTLDSSFEVGV